MATAPEITTKEWTLVDLADQFGPMPAWRIRTDPRPGTATVEDVIFLADHKDILCELVDGVLVQKTMMTAREITGKEWTLEDLVERFGPMPAWRIRTDPPPGTATEEDVTYLDDHEDILCELVDGVLVRKTVGLQESILAMLIGRLMGDFVEEHDLGVVAGEGGTVRLFPGQVRIPDVAFISWDRLGGRNEQEEAIPNVVPDLAIEVISKSNTKKEMEKKLEEYFTAGVRLAWFIDPRKKSARVYRDAKTFTTIDENGVLNGEDVLPGFELPMTRLFNRKTSA